MGLVAFDLRVSYHFWVCFGGLGGLHVGCLSFCFGFAFVVLFIRLILFCFISFGFGGCLIWVVASGRWLAWILVVVVCFCFVCVGFGFVDLVLLVCLLACYWLIWR